MPGAMRKLGLYLGLVEDDEDDRHPRGHDRDVDGYDDEDYDDEPVPARARPEPRAAVRRSFDDSTRSRGSAALDTAVRPATLAAPEDAYRITTMTPRTYNEARTIGVSYRSGTPVIMNLTEMEDSEAKRLVDFAAGLVFGLHGSLERVTNKVFLLSPEHVEVTAEDKARIVEGGFFNQS